MLMPKSTMVVSYQFLDMVDKELFEIEQDVLDLEEELTEQSFIPFQKVRDITARLANLQNIIRCETGEDNDGRIKKETAEFDESDTRFIPVQGDIVDVAPENGRVFELQELYKLLDCSLVQVLPCQAANMLMIIDEEGKLNQKSQNERATELVTLFPGDYIAGSALVCKVEQLQ